MAQDYQSQRFSDINRILTDIDLCTLDQDDLTCSICWETMEHNPQDQVVAAANMAVEDPAVRLNECGHIYCRDCITSWLTENSTCPACRRVVLPLPRVSGCLFLWRIVRSDCIRQLHVFLGDVRPRQDQSNIRNFLAFVIQRLHGFFRYVRPRHDESHVRDFLAFIEEMTSEDIYPNDLVILLCLRVMTRPNLFARENLIRWLAALLSCLNSIPDRDQQEHEQDVHTLAEFTEMVLSFERRRAIAMSGGTPIE